MEFVAQARRLPFSVLKMRPIANVVRGKSVDYALSWLKIHQVQRSLPFTKVIESAAANAHNLKKIEKKDLRIKEIRVDEGRTFRYYRPASRGRAATQKRRSCHISVILEQPQNVSQEV